MIGTKGTIGIWEGYGATEKLRHVEVEIIDTFYEPGDPVMAISVRELATGRVHGGLDSQDFRPFKEG